MFFSTGSRKHLKGSSLAFIGTVGIPNRYGGFEAFLEHCAPILAEHHNVTVTCWAGAYAAPRPHEFRGVSLKYLNTPANGVNSIIHDLYAFISVFWHTKNIVVLGVSGAIWFPLFRLVCGLTGKRLIVNVDGVEWKRGKFSPVKQRILHLFDFLAQRFAHHVVYDNKALKPFIIPAAKQKSSCIPYSGDHVQRKIISGRRQGALTICRIEPENNLDLLIDGFLASSLDRYTIIGNWQHSEYARNLHARHRDNPRLNLKMPIYDPMLLAEERERCSRYLHGHSVGGTNPSLVEMLFYDCEIFCFDVEFHRETAGKCASYFSSATALTQLLAQPPVPIVVSEERWALRKKYTARNIAAEYEALCC